MTASHVGPIANLGFTSQDLFIKDAVVLSFKLFPSEFEQQVLLLVDGHYTFLPLLCEFGSQVVSSETRSRNRILRDYDNVPRSKNSRYNISGKAVIYYAECS